MASYYDLPVTATTSDKSSEPMNSMDTSNSNLYSSPDFMPKNPVLGMAYVPFQSLGEMYDAEQGFENGTLFPELNKPFLAKWGSKNG